MPSLRALPLFDICSGVCCACSVLLSVITMASVAEYSRKSSLVHTSMPTEIFVSSTKNLNGSSISAQDSMKTINLLGPCEGCAYYLNDCNCSSSLSGSPHRLRNNPYLRWPDIPGIPVLNKTG